MYPFSVAVNGQWEAASGANTEPRVPIHSVLSGQRERRREPETRRRFSPFFFRSPLSSSSSSSSSLPQH